MKNMVAALILLLGSICGAAAQGGTGLRVYQVGEITFNRYAVLDRIWAGSWRASFYVSTHADEQSAVAALKEEAARLGADGIVNLHCLNDGGGLSGGAGHFCYANAIKLKSADQK
jgi:uncharacterized protein YbjQ (UPF0145 family)